MGLIRQFGATIHTEIPAILASPPTQYAEPGIDKVLCVFYTVVK
jgi:hypothetical protein